MHQTGRNPSFSRRKFLQSAALAACGMGVSRASTSPAGKLPETTDKADFTIHIAPTTFEIARGKTLRTIAYDGQVPGPLLRMKENVPIAVDVYNQTDHSEFVHWHGQMISSQADGSAEEGSPEVPARGHRRYFFTPRPAGCRWYHSHGFAGKDLRRSLFSGQFGFVYVEPKNDHGRYDQEVFLAMHQWEPFFTAMGEDIGGAPPPPNNGLEIGYRSFSFNDKALGHGKPVRVSEGERVLFHLLNASATEAVNVACGGHSFEVVALDGNPVPIPQTLAELQIGPAERVDAIVAMNQPGVWIMGTTDDDDRKHGFGVVIEYANRKGAPRWIPVKETAWDYTRFGYPASKTPAPDGRFELLIKKIPGGHGGFNRWTINGKSFPETDPLFVEAGKRYRLVINNQSDDAHPLHLHRHSFELTKIDGKATAGVVKDVVMVNPYKAVEVDFTADNPGDTLFHCHQQLHMDFGFMALVKYK